LAAAQISPPTKSTDAHTWYQSVRKASARRSSTGSSRPQKTTHVSRRAATSPAIAGPTIAAHPTRSRTSGATGPASTSGRIRRSPFSSARTPLVTAITSWPGRSNAARCSPAHSTPTELTPLTTISASSNAASSSSTW
jgi:hypothetical protein